MIECQPFFLDLSPLVWKAISEELGVDNTSATCTFVDRMGRTRLPVTFNSDMITVLNVGPVSWGAELGLYPLVERVGV